MVAAKATESSLLFESLTRFFSRVMRSIPIPEPVREAVELRLTVPWRTTLALPRLAAGFLVVVDFVAAGLPATDFFATDFFAAGFADVAFPATDFLAVGLEAAFVAAGFLATDFATDFVAVAFFATDFFAVVAFLGVDGFLAVPVVVVTEGAFPEVDMLALTCTSAAYPLPLHSQQPERRSSVRRRSARGPGVAARSASACRCRA